VPEPEVEFDIWEWLDQNLDPPVTDALSEGQKAYSHRTFTGELEASAAKRRAIDATVGSGAPMADAKAAEHCGDNETVEPSDRSVAAKILFFDSVSAAMERSLGLRPTGFCATTHTFREGVVHKSLSEFDVLPQLPPMPDGDLGGGEVEARSEGDDIEVRSSKGEGEARSDEGGHEADLVEATLAFLLEPTGSDSSHDDSPPYEPRVLVPSLWNLCRSKLTRRVRPTAAVYDLRPVAEAGEGMVGDEAAHDLIEMFDADWEAHPSLARSPEHFDIADQPPSKRTKSDADHEPVTDDWNDWAQSVAAALDDDTGAPPYVLEELDELIELEESGEVVRWPAGWNAQDARQAVHDRPRQVVPPRKRVRPNEESSARASIDESAFANASVPAVPKLGEAQLP
jgi:hypothetical protein